MQITVEIPDDLAAHLLATGKDPARAALELFAVEACRTRVFSEHQVRILLGFETRMEVHDLLAEHDVFLHYMLEHLQQDIRASDELYIQRTSQAALAE